MPTRRKANWWGVCFRHVVSPFFSACFPASPHFHHPHVFSSPIWKHTPCEEGDGGAAEGDPDETAEVDGAEGADVDDKERLSRLQTLLMPWVLLLEQWPVRMTWTLQILQDVQQVGVAPSDAMTLWEFYTKHVEPFVYNVGLGKLGSTSVAERYKRLFNLDEDPELFDNLVNRFRPEITLGDIGSLGVRRKDKLVSYCINLNPAIRETLARRRRRRASRRRQRQLALDSAS